MINNASIIFNVTIAYSLGLGRVFSSLYQSSILQIFFKGYFYTHGKIDGCQE